MPSFLEQAQTIAGQNKAEAVTEPFDESGSTESRVNRITSSGSPLMESAATAGTQLAASRGLTNSSLAAQASQQAVINAATPIATSDANLSATRGNLNLQAKNTVALNNSQIGSQLGTAALGAESQQQTTDKNITSAEAQQAKNIASQEVMQGRSLAQAAEQFKTNAEQNAQQIANQKEQFGQQLGQNQAQFTAGQTQQAAMQEKTLAAQAAIATLDANTRVQLANIESANKEAISGNQNIGQTWQQTMINIANIQNNPQIEAGAKQTLVQNQLASFQAYAAFWKKVGGGSIDITDLLNFQVAGGAPAAADSGASGNSGTGGGYVDTSTGG